MCGIAGIFEYQQNKPIDRDALMRMNTHMQSRGLDGSDLWTHEKQFIGLAHRRLSIIDLSDNAAQPMHDDGYVITFNGEIYNYRHLREQLIQQGEHFKTQSDTEVLLKLYRVHGEAMLTQLRGMFAFAIWDEKNQTLFCARDHFGIKPFYYSNNGHCFQFASQVKALLQGDVSQMNTATDAAGTTGFYLLGSVPEPFTLYQGIRALPAGHYLKVSHEKVVCHVFYSIKEAFISAENICADGNKKTTRLGVGGSLRAALYDTVKHHLVADVDVGLFLSAGIDSSVLTSVASDITYKKLHTITLGFREYQHTEKDETILAQQVALLYQTQHQTQWIDKAFAVAQFDRIQQSMDQPSIDGINTYFVSLAAAKSGMKVALSGLGADEIFAGYPLFSRIPTLLRFTKPLSRTGKLWRRLLQTTLSAKKASVFEYGGDITQSYFLSRAIFLPWELENTLDPDLLTTGLAELNLFERLKDSVAGIQSTRFQISALEMQWYMRNQLLRDTDWAAMAHSLEVRVPFVDVDFFENMIALQTISKQDLAHAVNHPLPITVTNRKKTGFNIPIKEWMFDGKVSSPKNLVALMMMNI